MAANGVFCTFSATAPVVSSGDGPLLSNLLRWPFFCFIIILFICVFGFFCKPPEATEINRAALVDQV